MWRRGIVTGTGALVGLASASAVVSLMESDNLSKSRSNESTSTKPPMSSGVQNFQASISKSRQLIKQIKESSGAPGVVVGVSVDGRTVWEEGFGCSDLENNVSCTPDTIMRIASISKSITMAIVAQLWEQGKIDLDKPVHEYIPNFPKKIYSDGNKTTDTFITSRHLASHQSGIRHYKKKNDGQEISEQDLEEFKSKEKFKNVTDVLKLFQDDPLHFEPGCYGGLENTLAKEAKGGTDFLYTTHGFTLLSLVVEKVSGVPFSKVARNLFTSMGLKHTYLDENEPLIYNRSRFYTKNKRGSLENAPNVDNSCKWAGGGLLSDIGDLLKFGNIMLYSSTTLSKQCPQGFLKNETVKKLWTTTTPKHAIDKSGLNYGLGWTIDPQREYFGMCGKRPKKIIYHDGGAMGGSSTLILRLPDNEIECRSIDEPCLPRGVVVAMITNLEKVPLRKVALEIAELFDQST